jgi:uncharacterized repeat protein (TIGR01451 family)
VHISFAATVDRATADNTPITNTARFLDPSGRAFERSATTVFRVGDLTPSLKDVAPATLMHYGDVATFTIRLVNGGGGISAFTVTDLLPASLVFVPGSLQASHGSAWIDGSQRNITWVGDVPGLHQAYLRFATRVEAYGMVTNAAHIEDGAGRVHTRSAVVRVSAADPAWLRLYLPVIVRDE